MVNRQAVELPQSLSYVPGEVIQSTIEIDNPQNKQIERVQCSIEQVLKVQDDSIKDKIIDITLPAILSSTEKHLERTFDIQILENIPPKFDFTKENRRMGIVGKVLYSIKFEVCVVGLLVDFSVTKPLTIAIDPWKHEHDGSITLIDRAQST